VRLEQAQQMALLAGWSYDIVHTGWNGSDEMLRIFGWSARIFRVAAKFSSNACIPRPRAHAQIYAQPRTRQLFTDTGIPGRCGPTAEIRYVHSRRSSPLTRTAPLRIIGTAQDFTEGKKRRRHSGKGRNVTGCFRNNPMRCGCATPAPSPSSPSIDAAVRLSATRRPSFSG